MDYLPIVLSLLTTFGVGSLLGARFNWKKEKEAALRKRREELVADWRQLVANAVSKGGKSNSSVLSYLETQVAFYSLKPHVKHALVSGVTTLRTVDTGVPESSLPEILNNLINEISRIEAEWKLS